jgi:hypothetical protein
MVDVDRAGRTLMTNQHVRLNANLRGGELQRK